MKNYVVSESSSGRKVYTDDFLSIQETAKSLLHLFEVCDYNFVIAGCNQVPSGDPDIVSVSPGYVYIDGDICYFEGGSIPLIRVTRGMLLRKNKKQITDRYYDGSIGSVFEDISVELTYGVTPSSGLRGSGSITLDKTGEFRNIKSEFFGKFCIIKGNSDGDVQVIDTILKTNELRIGDAIITEHNGNFRVTVPSETGISRVGLDVKRNGEVMLISNTDGSVNGTLLSVDTVSANVVKATTIAPKVPGTSINIPGSMNIAVATISNLSSTAANVATTRTERVRPMVASGKVELENCYAEIIDFDEANIGLGNIDNANIINAGIREATVVRANINYASAEKIFVNSVNAKSFECDFTRFKYDISNMVESGGTRFGTIDLHIRKLSEKIVTIFGYMSCRLTAGDVPGVESYYYSNNTDSSVYVQDPYVNGIRPLAEFFLEHKELIPKSSYHVTLGSVCGSSFLGNINIAGLDTGLWDDPDSINKNILLEMNGKYIGPETIMSKWSFVNVHATYEIE